MIAKQATYPWERYGAVFDHYRAASSQTKKKP